MATYVEIGPGPVKQIPSSGDSLSPQERLTFPWQLKRDGRPVSPPGFVSSVSKYSKIFKRRYLNRYSNYRPVDWLEVFLPCVRWLRGYDIRHNLLLDMIAGVSVGFMVVPQGMSYASLAGLPVEFGLYGALVPCLVYAIFGSSRQLAVGPVAVTSLLISSGMKNIVPGSADISNAGKLTPDQVPIQALYNLKVTQLAFIVACMYTAVGVLRLGFLTNFLSHSVIGGFTSGAAIIIGLSQVKYLLGFNVPRKDTVHEQIKDYVANMHQFRWQEYLMGASLLILLLLIKHCGKRYPRLKWLRPLGPITACVVGLVAVSAGNLTAKGIKVVGAIPKGLPPVTVGSWAPVDNLGELMPLALVVMLVDLLESTSIARALAAKNGYKLDSNQEIMGLGLANFGGAAFSAYTTTGSFSRSAVNNDSGARTGLAGFVTFVVVGFVLLFLTPVFEQLPMNALGAIVISGVAGLFDYEMAWELWQLRKADWAVWMASFLGTMFFGVEYGLAISIGLAMMIVIYESAFPHTAMLGRIGLTTVYRNVKQYPHAARSPGVLPMRIDAPLYFANVQYVRDRVAYYMGKHREYSAAHGWQQPLEYVVLDLSPVSHMDAAGVHMLDELHAELKAQAVQLALCNPSPPVVQMMERAGLPEKLGKEWIYVNVHDAVTNCQLALTERVAAASREEQANISYTSAEL